MRSLFASLSAATFAFAIALSVHLAFGQVTVTIPPPASARAIVVRPGVNVDGGAVVEVSATTQSAEGVVIDRVVLCDPASFTDAGQTCLAVLANNARACWRQSAIDGGL